MNMIASDQVRLFIAASLPEGWIENLIQAQAHLRKHSERISLTQTQNLHLTLRFIGEIAKKKLPSLRDYLESWVLPEAFPIKFSDYGRFQRGQEQLIYAELESSQSLTELANSLAGFPQELGIPIEKRRFKPHVTLARRAFLKQDFETLKKELPRDYPEETLQKLTLFQSEFTQTGMRYRPLKIWNLE